MATTQSKPKQSRKLKEPKSPEDIVIDFDSNWKYLIEKYYFLRTDTKYVCDRFFFTADVRGIFKVPRTFQR
jgi:hypothetical protein